jgi:hypothetical protein
MMIILLCEARGFWEVLKAEGSQRECRDKRLVDEYGGAAWIYASMSFLGAELNCVSLKYNQVISIYRNTKGFNITL